MDSNEFAEENCLIIRDRNSNLYSLQTRNNLLTASGTCRTNESKSVRLKNDSPEVKKRRVSHEDTSNTSGALVTGKQLPNHVNRHCTKSLDLEIAHSPTNVVTLNANKMRNHAIEENHPCPISVQQSSVSTNHTGINNFHKSDTTTQVPVNTNHQEFSPLPKLSDQEAQCTSSKANKEHADLNRNETTASSENAVKPTTLSRCPLCQHEFDPRFGQVEKDSHIAQCLSMSDDVVW